MNYDKGKTLCGTSIIATGEDIMYRKSNPDSTYQFWDGLMTLM